MRRRPQRQTLPRCVGRRDSCQRNALSGSDYCGPCQDARAPTWHEHRGELRTHPERVCGCGGRDLEPTPAMIAQRLRGEL